MPVEVKTLSGHTFQLECSDEDSIREVKEKIAARDDLPEKYNADLLKLLYSGKVLDDEKSLGSYTMKSDGFLVLVKRTPGRIPPPKKEPLASFNNPFGQPRSPFMSSMPGLIGQNANDPFSISSFPTSQQPMFPTNSSFSPTSGAYKPTFDPPSGASRANFGASSGAPNPFVPNEESDGHLQQLIDMGFNRAQAQKALEAVSYDFQSALDILTTGGLPETDEKSTLEEVVKERHTSKSSLISKNQPDPTLDENDDEETSPAATVGAGQPISALLRNNPQQLQALKETLKSQNPGVAKMLDDNPEEFFKMMDQINTEAIGASGARSGSGTGGGGGAPPGTITVSLSPKDQEAIANLQAMGFERNQSIEAYLCCDRNEQLAANYLLSAFD